MLSQRELQRYSRQMTLFALEGQERLKRANIFIAGAGGLGSPVATYLAAAGVGTITLVDNDRVDQSNLNRQVLHYQRDVGRQKIASAGEKLRELNPDITVNLVDAKIDERNVMELCGAADGIVDALDNFATRYLLNQVALRRRIPFFHGAINGWCGQATTIVPGETPCLKCIFPTAASAEVFPVVGVTPGFIGMVQSMEVLKYIVKRGRLLTGRLLLWDGLEARAEEVVVQTNPECEACGQGETRPK
jgi:molybdopterin-synthase adenylyltransferase